MAPIIDVADAIQIVRRRPRRSPSLMQAKAPKAAPNVYRATTVPEGLAHCCHMERKIVLTLDFGVEVRRRTCSGQGVHLREDLDEGT